MPSGDAWPNKAKIQQLPLAEEQRGSVPGGFSSQKARLSLPPSENLSVWTEENYI